jgi:hypothetical protein
MFYILAWLLLSIPAFDSHERPSVTHLRTAHPSWKEAGSS